MLHKETKMVEEVSILRINSDLHKKLVDTAEKNHMTIKGLTEKAIKQIIDEYQYNYGSLMLLIEKTPTLFLQKDFFKQEFVDAPRGLIRDVIQMIETDNMYFFKSALANSEKENIIKNLSNGDIEKIVLIVKLNSRDRAEDGIKKISDFIAELKLDKKDIRVALKTNDTTKEESELLFFVSYKKEESDNGTNT